MPNHPTSKLTTTWNEQEASTPARQARSRRRAEGIVAATVDLLGVKGLEEMSVAEVARRAEASIGGFYARFLGKQALLDYLGGRARESTSTAMRMARCKA
ncbi:MAG: AcrR family transcriptional regulator [Planctomycetota bacterium]|jgi:AcrR family transcriptional regulator